MVNRSVSDDLDRGIPMIIEYKDRNAPKHPGPWYTFAYYTGQRVTLSEFQGDRGSLERKAAEYARAKRREVRLVMHDGRKDHVVAVFGHGK